MTRSFLILLSLLACYRATALPPVDQIGSVTVLSDKNTVSIDPREIATLPILDQGDISVTYNLFSRHARIRELQFIDRIITHISPQYAQSYPEQYHRIDSVFMFAQVSIQAPMILDMEITRDFGAGICYVVNRFPKQAGSELLIYKESLPKFSWQISTSGNRVICGYDCTLATIDFGGRSWRVWFTPEIPYNAGPYKFGGLPGLILHAESVDGEYLFSCVSIRRGPKPITANFHAAKIAKKAHVYRRIAAFYQAPLSYLQGTPDRQNLYYAKNHKGPLDHTWALLYNPIELSFMTSPLAP